MLGLRPASEVSAPIPRPAKAAPLAAQLQPGRLLEISSPTATGRFTTAVSLVIHAQQRGEPCAWIQPTPGRLFPPDLAASGVDLSSLIVVHIPATSGSSALPRAAEVLLRSGAFGLVVIDLLSGAPAGDPTPWQSRLAALAREHDSNVILLSTTDHRRGSLGPLVSLRVAPDRRRAAAARFSLDTHVLKNKAGAPLEPPAQILRAPYGLE